MSQASGSKWKRNNKNLRIGILGAGIIGITSAMKLSENFPNSRITVYADLFTPNTTSDVSAGYWEPFCIESGSQQQYILKWGQETYDIMLDTARSADASLCGVQALIAYVLQKSQQPRIPFWCDVVKQFRKLDSTDIEDIFQIDHPNIKSGFQFLTTTCVITKYLPFLMNKLKRRRVEFVQKKFSSMNEILDLHSTQKFDYFINCCGIGAKDMLQDLNVYPVRGHVIRVKAPWIKHCIMLDDEVTYMLPLSDTVVLGGTTDKDVYETRPVEKEFEEILKRCSRIVPSLEHAEIVGKLTGLRPNRSNGVRLELELVVNQSNPKSESLKVIHNYGHGGSGVTLSWGCANNVLDILVNDLNDSPKSKL